MNYLGMFGKPIYAPKSAIVLRPHWQYNIKINGDLRYRQCCNRSKMSSPILRSLTLAYSYCIENPFQRLFLSIASHPEIRIHGGDASDSFVHSPGPSVLTLLSIYDQFIIGIDTNLERILIGIMFFLYRDPYNVIMCQVDFCKHSSTQS